MITGLRRVPGREVMAVDTDRTPYKGDSDRRIFSLKIIFVPNPAQSSSIYFDYIFDTNVGIIYPFISFLMPRYFWYIIC